MIIRNSNGDFIRFFDLEIAIEGNDLGTFISDGNGVAKVDDDDDEALFQSFFYESEVSIDGVNYRYTEDAENGDWIKGGGNRIFVNCFVDYYNNLVDVYNGSIDQYKVKHLPCAIFWDQELVLYKIDKDTSIEKHTYDLFPLQDITTGKVLDEKEFVWDLTKEHLEETIVSMKKDLDFMYQEMRAVSRDYLIQELKEIKTTKN